MKKTMQYLAAGGAAAAAALSVASLSYAQQQQQSQTVPPDAGAGTSVRAAVKRPLADVLMRMSRDTGVVVVADSTVAAEQVTPPAEATTAENLEAQVAALVRTLPSGATWGRLYLPAPPRGGRGYSGDAVAEYAMAQAKLFGKVGDAPAGQVEVLGKSLAASAAAPVMTALDLRPVYLVTNPNLRASAGAAAVVPPGASQSWSQMTEQQRQQAAALEAQRLQRMDPQLQGAVMRSMIQNMSPEQRRQMFQGMGGDGGRGGRDGRDGRRGGRGPGGF